MKCKECGYELGKDVAFCGGCGKPVVTDETKKKCGYCDAYIGRDLEYCTNCGKSTCSTTVDDNKRNKGNRKDGEDNDDEGGILGAIGDIVGKLFG